MNGLCWSPIIPISLPALRWLRLDVLRVLRNPPHDEDQVFHIPFQSRSFFSARRALIINDINSSRINNTKSHTVYPSHERISICIRARLPVSHRRERDRQCWSDLITAAQSASRLQKKAKSSCSHFARFAWFIHMWCVFDCCVFKRRMKMICESLKSRRWRWNAAACVQLLLLLFFSRLQPRLARCGWIGKLHFLHTRARQCGTET